MADKLTTSEISKMKVADLKKALKERGLSVSGTKLELSERLTASMASEEDDDLESSFFDDRLLENSVLEEESPAIVEPVAEQVVAEPAVETEEPKEKITAQVSPEVKTVTSPTLSDAEKIKQRAERFGVVNEDMKKQLRAERFGVSPSNTSSGNTKLSTGGAGADVDALKKRAERFGQVTSSTLSKVDEAERIRKRKDRFGDVTSATNNSPKIAKLNVSSEEEDKKKKRAERFGLS